MNKQSAKSTSLICVAVIVLLSLLANPAAVSAAGPPWTISGSVGAAGAGATLSYTDGIPQTATADGTGLYSFTVSDGFTGSVTPTKTGYTFTPDHKDYNNVTADISGEDYTATPITFTISGSVGAVGAGATLSYNDPGLKTVTADGSGLYSLDVSYGWSGTVTPTKTGYSFSPVDNTYSNVLADISGEDYTATPITFTISGSVGAAGAGATLSYSDPGPKTATADGSGNYTFSVSYGFSGTVTPSKTGYSFSPVDRTYSNVLTNQTGQNYAATAITFTISGSAGVAGATLTYTDGTTKIATADGSGNYSFSVSYNWSGTVTPAKLGYTFSPVDRTYSNVLTNQTGQDYTATAITFTISGSVGAAAAGATLSYTDGTPKTATADGSGLYSFTVSYNWSGTVIPSLAGFTFTPTSRSYFNVLSNQTGQNYTTTAITFTIAGNAGVAGATLTFTDGLLKTVTANPSGDYSLIVSYGWSGTVTPSKAGFTFTPVNIAYTNVLANLTGQNYTTTPVTFTISGSAGVPSARLDYAGVLATGFVTADTGGNYTFTVPYNWTGTVTPTLAGYSFSPVNRPYTNVLSNQTAQNFTATPVTFTISGSAGVAGARLDYAGVLATGFVTADVSGNYTLTIPYNWSGTVTPSLAGYTFSPINRPYTNVLANQTLQNYTATGITFTISGSAGVPSARLDYAGVLATGFVTADVSGNYTLTVPYNWSGTVTPSKTGYLFTPVNRVYTNVLANQTAQNYTALVTISGNAGVPGATLSYTDGTPKTATADGTGNYSFTVVYNWTGTVTPSKTGYLFSPVNKAYTNILVNQTLQNYTALVTISGNAGIAGAILSYTDGTPKTATADGSGNYSFTVIYNWTGTVTPSLAGYTFSPVNKVYTNVLANQTLQNYTALVTISGNAGIAGARLDYAGALATGFVTADGTGNYSFTVPLTWTGTVTPSLTGFTFAPDHKDYTNLLAPLSGENYVATAITFTISGNAGTAGATLSYTDGTPKTATANGSGLYSLTVSYNWSGTVTPSKTGFIFTPASKTYTSVLSDQTAQNYTATVVYSISGNVGAAGVTLTYIDGTTKTATSNGSGNYSFTVIHNWTGTVTPTRSGCDSFSPASIHYTNVTSNMSNQNYTASCIPPAPTLVSPTGNIWNNYNPTYTWNQVSTATYYFLDVREVSSNDDIITELYSAAEAHCNGTTCFVTPATTLGVENYTWFVDAWNPIGYGPYSPGMNFSTTADAFSNVNVYIGGTLKGDYDVFPNQNTRVNFPGVDSGPVMLHSSGAVNIIAAIRDSWSANGVVTSFAQLMGLPASQLSDTYVFPAYNNVTLNEQLRIGNVDTSDTIVTVTIGGVLKGTYPLGPNESTRVNYAGVDSGPVIVQGTPGVNIIAAIRDSWKANGVVTSFVQLMGLPASQVSDTYVFPAYNNVTLNEQLRIGNVDTSDTIVTVTIGGVLKGTYPLGPNASTRVNYAGVDSGPVIVQGTPGVHIIAAIRDSWSANGVVTSFAQLMGLPSGQLSDSYMFPSYNNVSLNEQLRIGNVDTVPTTVTVTIGGVVKGTYTLDPNASTRVNYAGVDSGPVVVQGTGGVHIIAAIRDSWKANGVVTSFIQLMGLPSGLLSDTFMFPAYNNVSLNEQLRFGAP